MKKIALFVFAVMASTVFYVSESSAAQDGKSTWPAKPITVIFQVSAGGSGDLEVKAMQQAIEAKLGVRIISDYQTGGGGIVAMSMLKRAKPDGYTLVYVNNPSLAVKELTTNPEVKALSDFDYLTNIVTEYRVLAARPDAPYSNVKELIAYCKSGKIPSVANSGVGSSAHLQIVMMEDSLGIKFNDVPFEGNSAAKAAFLGGHVELWAIDAVSAIQQAKAGQCKILAYCGETRHPALQDVPTFIEEGYPIISSTSRGFIAPKGLPREVKAVLIDAFESAAKGEAMTKYIDQSQGTLDVRSDEIFKALAEKYFKDVEKFAHMFKK
ncbi:MAG: tripartite tricarboxylate transporter substrate binding protein [Synergistaceae bacterium]|jgi:tripartite-type tricarboxylate transporter receptor subunit TctC|nr:tripartite tricarboxylate transporter substrate binding protein [Synergistaceae bacterium]